MDNKTIAKVFYEMADILEIKGESFFRVNGYRKGALAVENLAEDLKIIALEDEKQLPKLPGIGKGLSEKIVELVKTGKCTSHEKLKSNFPIGLLEVLHLRGLGPKKVKLFYQKLGIEDLTQLEKAAKNQKLRELDGMGEKSELDILKSIEEYKSFSNDRFLVDVAKKTADSFIDYLLKKDGFVKAQFAGSLRRGQESVGDIDILAILNEEKLKIEDAMTYFVKHEEVINILAQGDTKSSVILNNGMQVDLRIVKKESFGAALHYFTGSKEHNIQIRDLAKKNGMKVNEYGLTKGDKVIASETEKEMFNALGIRFIPPELRQGRNELEFFAGEEKIELVELKDIKCDLHCHSTYSDGKESIKSMAKQMIKLGYTHFAMTDHSKAVGVTGGMDEEKIKKQWKEIDKVQKELGDKIKIYKGCEVDILKDGSLDFSDEILKKLDLVIASAHINPKLSTEDQTKRIIKAVSHSQVNILGHPTGRLINKRSEIDFDMKKVIIACVENNVALEINSNPHRLDLSEKYILMAKDLGAKFSINTDSHSIDNTYFMQFGVKMARRGWLEKENIINTMLLSEFDNFI